MASYKKFWFITLLCILSACTTKTNIETFHEPHFTDKEVLRMKVNKIEVDSEFVPTFKRPNVEHLFPISIEKTAKNWAKDRLEAVDFSSTKMATVTIKDASVTEEFVKEESVFKPDNLKYRATLDMVIKITDSTNASNAETQIQAWRELIIPVNTEISEKEKYWNGMVTKLFDEFDTQMEKNIRQYLSLYLDSPKVEATYY